MPRPIVPALLAAIVLAAACGGAEERSATDSAPALLQDAPATYATPAPAPPVATTGASRRGAVGNAARGEEGAATGAIDAALSVSAELSPLEVRPDVRQAQVVPPASDAPRQTSPDEILGRSMIIRTGTASVEVRTLDSAITRARLLALRLGGYVGNTSVQGGRDQPRVATLELKLPSTRFDEALAGLAPIGRVEAVNVSAEDVSEEYVDVAARVANGRRLEEQLVRLLERRTGRLSDALEVERELARVREQIERYEGRMRWLRTRAAVSTLSLSLHEPMPLIAQQPGDRPIRDAFVQAWRNLLAALAFAVASLGVLIPLAVVAWIAWAAWRRWGPRFAPRAPAPAPRTSAAE